MQKLKPVDRGGHEQIVRMAMAGDCRLRLACPERRRELLASGTWTPRDPDGLIAVRVDNAIVRADLHDIFRSQNDALAGHEADVVRDPEIRVPIANVPHLELADEVLFQCHRRTDGIFREQACVRSEPY